MASPLLKEPVADGSESSVEGALGAFTALGPEAGALVDPTLTARQRRGLREVFAAANGVPPRRRRPRG